MNGKSYQLTANNGPNTLHGGPQGWGKKDWEGPTPTQRNGRDAVLFKYVSKDGDEGFPGTVEMKMWYTPSLEQDEGVEKTSLEIEYEVELIGDEVEETAVSLTNHRYAGMRFKNALAILTNISATSTSPTDPPSWVREQRCTPTCTR